MEKESGMSLFKSVVRGMKQRSGYYLKLIPGVCSMSLIII